MKRWGVLVAVMAGLFLCQSASAAQPCSVKRKCSHRLVATDKLAQWRTPQRFGADEDLQIRIRLRRRWVSAYRLTAFKLAFLRGSFMVIARAKAKRARLRLHFASAHRARFKVVYWTR